MAMRARMVSGRAGRAVVDAGLGIAMMRGIECTLNFSEVWYLEY